MTEEVLPPQAPDSVLEAMPQPNVSQPVAFNRAYIDSLVTNTPESLNEREAAQRNHNLIDESIRIVGELVESRSIADTGELDNIRSLPPEKQVERLQFMLAKQDMNTASSRNIALMLALQVTPEMDVKDFNQMVAEIPFAQLTEMKQQFRTNQQERLRKEYANVLASAQAEGTTEAVSDFVVGEMLPFYSVLSRFNLSSELLETIKPNADMGVRGWFTGEVRQEIRKTLVEMSPDERIKAVQDMVGHISDMERDPALGFTITDYNVRETVENLLTDELLTESDAGNTFDRWIGNLEVALGLVGTAWVVGKFGTKSVSKTLTSTNSIPAKQAADVTGNTDYISDFHKALLDNKAIAGKFGITKEEAIVANFPKPEQIVDDITIVPPGTKELLTRQERIRSRILENTNDVTGFALTPQNKMAKVEADIAALDLADEMEIMPAMSRLSIKADDTGYNLWAVIGKTAKGGFDDLEEVAAHIKTLDADLTRFRVVRRTASGGTEEVFRTPGELKEFLETGTVPRDNPYLPAGIRLSDLTDDQVLDLSRELGPELSQELLEREARRRAGTAPIKDEFFLEHEHDYFWHPMDKEFFGTDAFTGGLLNGIKPLSGIIAPNAKFGDEIYGSMARMWLKDQQLSADLELMFEPYYKLGKQEKRVVNAGYEWAEQFAKENGRVPKVADYRSRFPELTGKQLDGLIALKEGHDTMYQLLNRRLYREFISSGYKTARPVRQGLPVFHGKPLTREEAYKNSYLHDPVANVQMKMKREDIDALYDEGGSVLKNDLPIETDNGKVSNILIDGRIYQNGELSSQVLAYHKGYGVRFYEDPYIIIRTSKQKVDGQLKEVEEAVRMSPTQGDARAYVTRSNPGARPLKDGSFRTNKEGVTLRVERMQDISQTDVAFQQKEILQREGRLFWDERNADRLLDTQGNKARIIDPSEALGRQLALLSREVTTKETTGALQAAWKAEFGDLLGREAHLFDDMGSAIKHLQSTRRNSTVKELNQRLDKAIELAKYINFMQGSGDPIAPAAREALIRLAGSFERVFGNNNAVSRLLEKHGTSFDPLKTARSVPFTFFMKMRPARQYLLQSAQISFIAGIDPGYAAKQIFLDRHALGAGLNRFVKSGYDDGIAVKKYAKIMGLSRAEYMKVVKEFNRSGIINSIDAHTFKGGVPDHIKHDHSAPRKALGAVGDKLLQYGFDAGEGNNIMFSYLMALRRFRTESGKGINQLSKADWDKITTDASNLSLGMIRPNDFGYQRGYFSLATQFMSFQNKAALALFGQNPAFKGKDLHSVWMATHLMYGGNMFGARNFMEGVLSDMGADDLANEVVGPYGETMIDALTGGAVETIFNTIGEMQYGPEWQDLDLTFLAPGVDVTRVREMALDASSKGIAEVALGPFGSVGTGILGAVRSIGRLTTHDEYMAPGDKVYLYSAYVGQAFPWGNDLINTEIARKTGHWVQQAGDITEVNATANSLWARGMFGIRTRQEVLGREINQQMWEDKEKKRAIAQEISKYVTRQWQLLSAGEVTLAEYDRALAGAVIWMEDWPEGEKLDILESILNEDFDGQGSLIEKWASDDGVFGNRDIRRMMKNWMDANKDVDPDLARQLLDLSEDVSRGQKEAEEHVKERIRQRITE